MLDFRYLTTIPGFIAQTAAMYRGQLHVGGAWTDPLVPDSLDVAPLVRIGLDGALDTCYSWARPEVDYYGNYVPLLGQYDLIRRVCVWQDRLWVAQHREFASTISYRLYSLDALGATIHSTNRLATTLAVSSSTGTLKAITDPNADTGSQASAFS